MTGFVDAYYQYNANGVDPQLRTFDHKLMAQPLRPRGRGAW